MTQNAINWFEIPVNETARAKKFYENLLQISMETTEMMGFEMTFFPAPENAGEEIVAGALIKGDMHKPSTDGVVIYLNANPDIQAVIDRIEPNGGKVLMPKTLINENIGYMSFFLDTEGNRIALHANS